MDWNKLSLIINHWIPNSCRSTLVLITNLVNVYTSSTRDPAKYFPNERINATFSVWSILTSSNAILKQWIGIPASATLSSLADVSAEKNEPSIRVNGDDAYGGCESELVTLSAEDKTLGLLLNASRLQATNFNWTFESVRATHGVGGWGINGYVCDIDLVMENYVCQLKQLSTLNHDWYIWKRALRTHTVQWQCTMFTT